jgi:molybdate transport system ATP-binding protein
MIETVFTLKREKFTIILNETFQTGITGIFGPSGSGKTSILHAISGLTQPQSGTIRINGKEVFNSVVNTNIAVHKRNIGYVFQDSRLFPHLSVKKNLCYGMKKNASDKLGFDEVVSLLKLEHILDKKPATISGGEKQRTALGRALLSSPEVLLLDEPFSALDTGLRNQIIPYLHAIQAAIDIPVLVVSHELQDLLKLTHRLCIIKDGCCIGHDDYQNLLLSQTVSDLFGTDSILNTFTLQVHSVDLTQGITVLTTPDSKNCIRVLCEKCKQEYIPGQKLTIFINSQDIALSIEKLDGITIQNQLEGIIIDIYNRGPRVYCIIDTGLQLIVEITNASLNRMAFTIGSNVWCLFKSLSIDVAI